MQDELKNIKLIFLPANTTSLIQPMDQGVIQNWKCHYKSELNRRIVRALELDPTLTAMETAKQFTLLNAIYLAHEAWKRVTPKTIANCFAKGGFVQRAEAEETEEPPMAEHMVPVDDEDFLEGVGLPENMDKQEFLHMVAMDADLDVFGEMSNAELLQTARGGNESDEEDDTDQVPQSMAEKYKMVEILRRFVEENGLGNPTFKDIEREVIRHGVEGKKQMKIQDYFKK